MLGLSALLILPATAAAAAPELTEVTVAFDMPMKDVIAGVAAFRAHCAINASGEEIRLLANETARTTIAAVPGACAMVLTLFGFDIGIPTINTTPLGRDSVYLPGLSVVTLGIVDISLDLMTSMNSTTRMEDPAVAAVTPAETAWPTWGAIRFTVRGADGYGSAMRSNLNTTFTYALSLGLTISALGVTFYHTDLVDLGRYTGTPSLRTPVVVDLIPRPLVLGPATDVTAAGAVLNWTGAVDTDVDHLDLWVTDGTLNRSYRIADPATSRLRIPLEADTGYRAWIVTVDHAGQSSSSAVVSFHTATAPPTNPELPSNVVAQANGVVVGTVAAAAALLVFIAFLLGEVRGRKKS